MARDPRDRAAPYRIPSDAEHRLAPGGGVARSGMAGGRPIVTSMDGGRQAAVTVYPPQYMRPPQAVDFNPDDVVSGAGGPTTVSFSGLNVELPPSTVGVVKALTLNVNDLLPTSEILFTLFFDGSPVNGWRDLRIFPRNAASVSLSWGPEELALPVPEGAEISVECEIVDGGTYDVGGRYHGWYYSTDLEARFSGAWS